MSTELLGEIVTWDTKAAEIDLNKIRTALSSAGLSEDVAKDLNNRSAFSRAAKHLKENRSIDKVKETKDGDITFQLTKKVVDKDREVVDFDYETQITLHTKNGDITCGNAAIESEARQLIAHAMQVRTASDITRMVQSLFKNNADLFPINPHKGVAYFCPAEHREFTEKVEVFMAAVGGEIWRFPVPKGTEQGNASVRDAVAAGLQAILDELDGAVGDWDDSTRQDTMKRGIEKWKTIKFKAEAYAEYLQTEQASLLERIDQAKQRLVDKVSSLAATDTAAAA